VPHTAFTHCSLWQISRSAEARHSPAGVTWGGWGNPAIMAHLTHPPALQMVDGRAVVLARREAEERRQKGQVEGVRCSKMTQAAGLVISAGMQLMLTQW